ncbi:tyrosine-type recombinase/integrase [Sporosarcina sp. 179-K 3D1 HS]|uniref:tyrosine-type recombinase/integrase n=1 Tax=Sporosarcina sp. 179-K 3D1 HS TaxID=3232169 RepID=UPI0039A14E4E
MTIFHKQNVKGALVDVQPLREQAEIKQMIEALAMSPTNGPRNVLLFKTGISTGLRAGDIVKLRIEDVKGRTQFKVREGKTRKERTVHISAIMPDIADYIESIGNPSQGWLFPSRKGDKNITTTQCYRILTEAGELIGKRDVGTHSMRKTFGYHYYKRTKDVATLMEIFNHESQRTTLRYIGITEEEVGNSLKDFRLF